MRKSSKGCSGFRSFFAGCVPGGVWPVCPCGCCFCALWCCFLCVFFVSCGGLSPLRPPCPVVVLPSSVVSLLCAARVVGVSGSRCVVPPAVGAVCAWLAVPGVPVFVGCAGGVDAAVRSSVPGARVFRASSFSGGSFSSRLVRRSCAFVGALASLPSPLLVSFPAGPCPAGCVPGASWVSCGSGSWSSAALAAGCGVPVLLFLGSWRPSSWPGLVSLGGGWWVFGSLQLPLF